MFELGRWYDFKYRGTWGEIVCWHRWELRGLREMLQMDLVWKLPLWMINLAVVRATLLAMGPDKSPDEIGYSQMYRATDPYQKHKEADSGAPS